MTRVGRRFDTALYVHGCTGRCHKMQCFLFCFCSLVHFRRKTIFQGLLYLLKQGNKQKITLFTAQPLTQLFLGERVYHAIKMFEQNFIVTHRCKTQHTTNITPQEQKQTHGHNRARAGVSLRVRLCRREYATYTIIQRFCTLFVRIECTSASQPHCTSVLRYLKLSSYSKARKLILLLQLS